MFVVTVLKAAPNMNIEANFYLVDPYFAQIKILQNKDKIKNIIFYHFLTYEINDEEIDVYRVDLKLLLMVKKVVFVKVYIFYEKNTLKPGIESQKIVDYIVTDSNR